MERFGNFSSSSIWKLTTVDKSGKEFGEKAKTYIKEKSYEIELGRSLENEAKAKPTMWGNICEPFAFGLLGLEYKLISKERIAHPTIKRLNGMPDNLRTDADKKIVGDTKCPFTLKSFVEQIKAHEQGLETYKKEFPEYYWQLINNAILTNSTHIECILFVPYLSQLKEIRESVADNLDYNFLNYMSDNELPYLIEGGKFKNINTFVYEVPKQDIEFLENCVNKANLLLDKYLKPKLKQLHFDKILERIKNGENLIDKTLDYYNLTDEQEKLLKASQILNK
jgi:hypothetical protein